MATLTPPRITALNARNYRALRDVTLKELTPLTVLLGPNGSGKSTVFDVFAFLSECFTDGVRKAWDRRGRFRELRKTEAARAVAEYIDPAENRSGSFSVFHRTLMEVIPADAG